jgi:Uncharacterized conserved protein
MPEIIVFLGPSLDRPHAEQILSASYRPPAARGDILRATEEGARVIALIDGVFHQDSAVAHREILHAIRSRVLVVGASSMGALRAAELDQLGMVGIGEVYRMYREGILESDDEVALVFDPATGIALSEPLVNIRATLQAAEEQGILDAGSHAILLEAARGTYYPERTYPRICDAAGRAIPPSVRAAFLAFVQTGAVDVKRQDAIQALEYIRERVGSTGTIVP